MIRADGRKPSELRKISCKLGVFAQADGSAYLEMGDTNVLAAVFGPHEVTRTGKSKGTQHDRAVINCQYNQATFSTTERKKKQRTDIRSNELTNNIKEIFDHIILTNVFPNSQIDILLQVLQSDGSNLSACVNASTLALIHAGIPVRDFVISCSVSLVDDNALVDVSHIEESTANIPVVTLSVLPKTNQIVSMESCGRVPLDKVEYLIDSATKGCESIHKLFKDVILGYVSDGNVAS